MQAAAGSSKRTALNPLFREMGARLVEFAGWEMPVQFSSVLEEHRAVRAAAGLFDVSHMGEIEIGGEGALPLIQNLTCNDAARLQPGQAQYSVLTTPSGTFIDDILVYCRGSDRYLLVVNAGNTDKNFEWIARHALGNVEVVNTSLRWAQLAVQGPSAQSIVQGLTSIDLGSIRYYHFVEGEVRGVPALVSRTGYTGENGFEIYSTPGAAPDLFRAILEAGRPVGLLPCGLAARDTLRLEAGMLLYGHDIDETISVLEAGLQGIVRMAKGDFIGRDTLRRQGEEGLSRTLVGFEMIDRGIARQGYAIRSAGGEVGRVTSGTFGPHVRKNIGLGYVPVDRSRAGTRFTVVIRGNEAEAVVVPTPFYKRPR